MRFIFLNRFYWPEEPATGQLLTDLAEALAAAGNEVTVITSRPAGATLAATEVRHGVGIHRVSGTRWAAAGVAGKAADFLSYYLRALFALLRRVQPGTIVVAMTDPPLLGWGAWLTARARGAAIVHWVQDVYPEIAIALSGQRWLGVLYPFRNAAWRRADGCVVVGADMADLLADAGVARERIHVIPNRAPAGVRSLAPLEAAPLRRAWDLEGKFVVAYSGNLGRVHDLDPILDVAAARRDDARVVFLFIGDGPQRARLEEAARERALANVQFRPSQPRSHLAETLAVADLHLVTLRAGCERFVFPSKFHGAVAANRPMLFIGPATAEPARLIREHQVGFAFTRDETAAAAATVGRLAADPGEMAALAGRVRALAATHEATARWAEAWNAVFQHVAAGHAATRRSPLKHLAG